MIDELRTVASKPAPSERHAHRTSSDQSSANHLADHCTHSQQKKKKNFTSCILTVADDASISHPLQLEPLGSEEANCGHRIRTLRYVGVPLC